MLEYLTVDLAKSLLLKQVEKKGEDYIYTDEGGYQAGKGGSCLYMHRTENDELVPGCLVGGVVADMGLPMSFFDDSPALNCFTDAKELFGILRGRGLIAGYDYDAVDMLYRAQVAQDEGDSWGEAVERATSA